jgi:hypothetical protein
MNERPTPLERAALTGLVLFCLLFADKIGPLVQAALTEAAVIIAEPTALCSTDLDCMRLCPPTERDCDGGPQSLLNTEGGK